jgi:hypothetical protein
VTFENQVYTLVESPGRVWFGKFCERMLRISKGSFKLLLHYICINKIFNSRHPFPPISPYQPFEADLYMDMHGSKIEEK